MVLGVFQQRRDGRAPLAFSMLAHVFIVAALAAITFHVPLAAFFGPSEPPHAQRERVQFTKLQPEAGNGVAGTPGSVSKPASGMPAPLIAPSVIPNGLPPIPQPGSLRGSSDGHGIGTPGSAGSGGITSGLHPVAPDPRLSLGVGHYALPKTQAERTDSVVRQMFAEYTDSIMAAQANAGRAPGDWTWGSDGHKWGWDPKGIHVGKYTIPNALLALLPIRTGGVDGQRYRDAKTSDYMRNDILIHSGVTADDFRDEVRRIRERVDQERRDDQQAKAAAAAGAKGAKETKVIVP
jgi:hypothetical protein